MFRRIKSVSKSEIKIYGLIFLVETHGRVSQLKVES